MTSSELPSEPPEQPSQGLAQVFDYVALDVETRIIVQQRTSEIKQRAQDTLKTLWEIGQKLVEIREHLGYGLFDSWLKTEFQWSRRTAYNYIRIFESFSCAMIAQLEIAPTILYLLAAETTPEAAREEAIERALAGEKITESKVKELIKQSKPPATPKTIKQVTLDVAAEVVEEESASSTEVSFKPMENSPTDTDQSEQELLGKELETLPSEVSISDRTIQINKVDELTGSKNKGEKKMERQQVHEVYKNLRANINYIVQENIFYEIDLDDLKSLEQEIASLVRRKEASLNNHYNSNYSNN